MVEKKIEVVDKEFTGNGHFIVEGIYLHTGIGKMHWMRWEKDRKNQGCQYCHNFSLMLALMITTKNVPYL
jgi:hypothetical protein